MKKFILLCNLCLTFVATAQQITFSDSYEFADALRSKISEAGGKIETYTVDRGKTWEDIAHQFNAEVDLLKALNPGFDIPYAGMDIDIPVQPQSKPTAATQTNTDYKNQGHERVATDIRFYDAKRYYDIKNYKKSAKKYSEIIKYGKKHLSKNDYSLLFAHYNRGISYLKMNKYGKAAKDFLHVSNYCNTSDFPDIDKLYADAKAIDDKRKAEKAQMWGQIISTTLAAAADTYIGIESAKQANKQYESTSLASISRNHASPYSTSYATGGPVAQSVANTDYQQVYTQLMQKTLVDFEIKQEQEYQEFCRFVRKPDGSLYTRQEFNMMKAQAYADSKNASDENSNEAGSYSGKPDKDRGTQKYDSGYGKKDCHLCRGTGICQTCGGDGIYDRGLGLGNGECPNCLLENMHRTGKCSRCQGTGKVYGKIY